MLFPRAETLNQIAFVKVLNSDAEPLRATANVQIAGKTVQTELTIAPGASDQRVLVPDIDAPAKLLLELRAAGGERLAAAEQPWQPQRKWKVFIVRSSHEDLGYEDFIYKKQAENAELSGGAQPNFISSSVLKRWLMPSVATRESKWMGSHQPQARTKNGMWR